MHSEITLIGIDGGASKVSAYEVMHSNKTFTLGHHNSTKEYKIYSDFQNGFKPVDLKTQLKEIENKSIKLTESEKIHAQAYYSAFIDTITEITKSTDSQRVLIGIGMPGIKSADDRGIIAMANGPRMPFFTEEIEQRLHKTNIKLLAPISRLGSDADYCGIGEEYAESGAFRNIQNAYYLGGGTGVADAIKLHGKLISFDECKNWIAKTWEMCDENGKSMEIYCSANGIQSLYSVLSTTPQVDFNEKGIFLEKILELADKGDRYAIETWQIVTVKLVELLFERMITIYSGWQNNFSFIDENKKSLTPEHVFKKTLLDNIIIGQRLGNTLKKPLAQKHIIAPLINNLTGLINENQNLNTIARSHYLKSGKFNSSLIIFSQLNAAPALGAGIDAWQSYQNE